MIKLTNERDFCLFLGGLLAGRDLSGSLAGDALTWFREAGGPREGTGSEIGQLLGRLAGLELDPIEASVQLRLAVSDRLEALAPERVIQVIRDKVAQYANRLAERAPAMESDLRDLDRVSKLLQIRAYLTLEGLNVRELVERHLQRLETETEVLYDADARRQEVEQQVAFRDRAYTERNTLACVVARCIVEHGGNAGTWHDGDGEPGFQTVVGFELPVAAGAVAQVSFHMDERDPRRPWETLPKYPGSDDGNPWDGHTDHAKWLRVRDFLDTPIGALKVFARDQICAAGFPLDGTHPPDIAAGPCAHFPNIEAFEQAIVAAKASPATEASTSSPATNVFEDATGCEHPEGMAAAGAELAARVLEPLTSSERKKGPKSKKS